eukprot:87132_1
MATALQLLNRLLDKLINKVEHSHEHIIDELSELQPSNTAIDNDQRKEMRQKPLRLESSLSTYHLDKEEYIHINNPCGENVYLHLDIYKAIAQDLGEQCDKVLCSRYFYHRMKKVHMKQKHTILELPEEESDDIENAENANEQGAVEKDQTEWLQIMKNLQSENDELRCQLADANAKSEAARAAVDQANSQQSKQDFGPQAMKRRVQNDQMAAKVPALSAAKVSGQGDEIQEVMSLIEEDNKKWQRQLDSCTDSENEYEERGTGRDYVKRTGRGYGQGSDGYGGAYKGKNKHKKHLSIRDYNK